MIQYITYRRVSSAEQGRSGLGLEAQSRDIDTYLKAFSGKPYKVIGEFLEILSGASDARPELFKAVALARKTKAILLVSKLDRLSRKVSYISALMEDKTVQFKVANLPQASNFELHLYASLAEQERAFISERTKAALREAQARGVKLGGLRDSTMQRNKVRAASALSFARSLEKIVMPKHKAGESLKDISVALNDADIKTVRGGVWTSMQVSRVIGRLQADAPVRSRTVQVVIRKTVIAPVI
ncbi:recombinase family protein [Polynucleobacter antarcticus]|uniref:DNA invertase n=1 Tax=Polynucleobacter antarcticus TaxID=1743162 RepID=A0A6M9PSY8_9BURK|nr:recombinase family protein [Polynucleobacter antarcticus]QKM62578.1 DNA invertase [Polynucleobacter antarcticus]